MVHCPAAARVCMLICVSTATMSRKSPRAAADRSPGEHDAVDPPRARRRHASHRATGVPAVRSVVLRCALAGFVAVLLLSAVTVWVSVSVATQRAIEDARSLARVAAQGIVAPTLHDDLIIESDASALLATDEVVRSRVLGASLVRVKIWAMDGTIVYSDEPGLIGERFGFSNAQRAAFASGDSQAGVSPLNAAENRFEGGSDLLEVYQPIETVEGTPLLFEAYFRHGDITDVGGRLWWHFVPVMIIALLALELVQIPLAWRMARRLRASQQERERLIRRAIDASELERRRLAVDMHHGVVQDLSAVSFDLASQGRRPAADPATAAEAAEAAESIRASITSLRALFGEIAPHEVTEDGLEFAIRDLMAGLPARGVEAALEVSLDGSYVDVDAAALAYRVVQEAMRNAVGYAHATALKVTVSASDGLMNVVVDDNGRRVEPDELGDQVDDASAVLELLADRLAAAGGSLGVLHDATTGTRVVARIRLATADDAS
jgi:two-component system, NarL family, sensor kinase